MRSFLRRCVIRRHPHVTSSFKVAAGGFAARRRRYEVFWNASCSAIDVGSFKVHGDVCGPRRKPKGIDCPSLSKKARIRSQQKNGCTLFSGGNIERSSEESRRVHQKKYSSKGRCKTRGGILYILIEFQTVYVVHPWETFFFFSVRSRSGVTSVKIAEFSMASA